MMNDPETREHERTSELLAEIPGILKESREVKSAANSALTRLREIAEALRDTEIDLAKIIDPRSRTRAHKRPRA